MSDELAAQVEGIQGIAALAEPARRALYRYVVAQDEPVGRDRAAEGVGVARHTAKFHLDKLVDEGLLEVEFRRPAGRSGPGAGRPSKLYRRSDRELRVSLPDRRYDLAGELLATAIDESTRTGSPAVQALDAAAHRRGQVVGDALREGLGPRPTRSERVAAACDWLASCGYEPRIDRDRVELANCPFHALAAEHTELVCGMNLALVAAVVDGLGDPGLRTRLAPHEGHCCVVVEQD